MKGMARHDDPATSHSAAREHVDTGRHGRQQMAAIALVQKYPGCTYRELWQRHCRDGRQRGEAIVFTEPVALMRRLSEIATRGPAKTCPVTGRKAITWRYGASA